MVISWLLFHPADGCHHLWCDDFGVNCSHVPSLLVFCLSSCCYLGCFKAVLCSLFPSPSSPQMGGGYCTVQGPLQQSPKLTEVWICCWWACSCPMISSLLLFTCLDKWYVYFGCCVSTGSVWFWMPVTTRNFEHECSLLSLVKCYRWEVLISELVSECCKLNFLVLLIAWAFIIVIYLLLKGCSVLFLKPYGLIRSLGQPSVYLSTAVKMWKTYCICLIAFQSWRAFYLISKRSGHLYCLCTESPAIAYLWMLWCYRRCSLFKEQAANVAEKENNFKSLKLSSVI